MRKKKRDGNELGDQSPLRGFDRAKTIAPNHSRICAFGHGTGG